MRVLALVLAVSYFLMIVILSGCSVTYLPVDLPSMGTSEVSSESTKRISARQQHHLYSPDSNMPYKTPMRTIRVSFVFMNSLDRTRNLTGEMAYQFASDLIDQANYRLSKNQKMNLPIGNSTAVHPINFRLEAYPNRRDCVHFEYDDELYYVIKRKTQYDRRVINKYNVGMDSILNIFIMPHHPDSVGSKTYGSLGLGIALGTAIKVNGDFVRNPEAWIYGGTLVHEIGHVLGLSHTWRGNDRCDDTPPNPNCWGPSDNPPCDKGWSNNLMDYNKDKSAVTPCQLGIINSSFNRSGSKVRRLLVRDWQQKSQMPIYIDIDTNWDVEMDITSDVIVRNGARLVINSPVRFAKQTAIYLNKHTELSLGAHAKLYNEFGENWLGVFMEKKGGERLEMDPRAQVLNVKK